MPRVRDPETDPRRLGYYGSQGDDEAAQNITLRGDAKGSLEVFGLPFYVSHSFVAYTDKGHGGQHCVEEVGMGRSKDGRPMLETCTCSFPKQEAAPHYADTLVSMYRDMLLPDRLVLSMDKNGSKEFEVGPRRDGNACKFQLLGLHDVAKGPDRVKTPGPWLGDILKQGRKDAEVFMAGRSLVFLVENHLYEGLARAILKDGLKCSFIIADPTRPDLTSLVEDYAQLDVLKTWPVLSAVFKNPQFTQRSESGGFIEVYGVFAYLPVTYASYAVGDKRYSIIEPGIGVDRHKRPKICFQKVDPPGEDLYTQTERIYRDILEHCRCTQSPLLGMKIQASDGYRERLQTGNELLQTMYAGVENPKIVCGNAQSDGGERGWFVGHFMDPSCSLRRRGDLEVKWGVHKAGEKRTTPGASGVASTLTLLIRGKFVMEFPTGGKGGHPRTEILETSGDYVLYASGVPHTWRVLEDAVVVTVRWPSVPD